MRAATITGAKIRKEISFFWHRNEKIFIFGVDIVKFGAIVMELTGESESFPPGLVSRAIAQLGLARLTGGQKVESSNLSIPTICSSKDF